MPAKRKAWQVRLEGRLDDRDGATGVLTHSMHCIGHTISILFNSTTLKTFDYWECRILIAVAAFVLIRALIFALWVERFIKLTIIQAVSSQRVII